ncbi:MAG: sodium ion-translocating decarboxylase subunit beta [Dehalococcoidia bacterium]|nr:sodium ion-translocating decarboxylase subunit beta [Dehalococcoidia bacterium]
MLQSALTGLVSGFTSVSWQNIVMMAVGLVLLYLAIRKGFEPLLLVPIGFGALLVNFPLAGFMDDHGVLRQFYNAGILTEILPVLIFVGVGAMIDFGPVIANPVVLLLGAAGQFGIFLTLLLALQLGFTRLESASIGVIGAMDGPTAIYVTSQFAPHLLGAVSVAAYSYMSLVPILQPPIMRLLTTKKERQIVMSYETKSVSKRVKIVFPIIITILTGLIAPFGLPLMGALMLGNFMRECGVVGRLANTAQNELVNIVTLLLGITIGATMMGEVFLKWQTMIVFGLGLIAIVLDTATGVLLAKLLNVITHGKINPLLGAAGTSAFPMSSRVVQREGQKANPKVFLLWHAVGANTGGQLGSVMAAAVMIAILKGLGIA